MNDRSQRVNVLYEQTLFVNRETDEIAQGRELRSRWEGIRILQD